MKETHYQRNKEELLKKAKETYQLNKQGFCEKNKAYNIKNKEVNKLKHRKYYEKNKEVIKLKRQKYYEKNKETINNNPKNKKRLQKYYIDNKHKLNTQRKDWLARNSERLKEQRKSKEAKLAASNYRKRKEVKEKANESYRRKYKNNPVFRLRILMSGGLRNAFKSNGLRKTCKTEKTLGCSFTEFKSHLEKQFEPWMNWSNQGKYNGTLCYGWDVDHIVPISIAKTEEEVMKLSHYTNLQPLCSFNNRHIKKNKY